ncbi:MAG: T9SS type A sorting domain-containing protein [Bacteroidota bacterium]
MLRRLYPAVLSLVFCSLIHLTPASAAPADTVYVDQSATGTNNGTSWANAYTNLQTAISTQAADKVFLVAQGTYYPSATANPNATFSLKSGHQLYGGFPAGGTAFGLRKPKTNVTVLSGDLNRNSTPENGVDAYTVVTLNGLANAVVIDGFTISGGENSGAQGAGIIILNTEATISNNIIENNIAEDGAGIYNVSFLPVSTRIFKNTIRFNTARNLNDDGKGGGIYIEGQANIYNNLIYKNFGGLGGGIYAFQNGYDAFVINNTVANNRGGIKGIAYKINSGSVSYFNNVIWNNEFAYNFNGSFTDPDSLHTRNNIAPNILLRNKRGNLRPVSLADSIFMDTTNNNFALKKCGLGVEAADSMLLATATTDLFDLLGNPRYFDNDFNGSPKLDMGALESTVVCEPCTTSVGPDDQICGFAYVLSAKALGFQRTGLWTQVAGPSGGSSVFTSATSSSSQVNVNLQGTYTFRWTLSGEDCSTFADVKITFFRPSVANAGPPVSSCGKTATLAAVPSSGSGIWSGPAGVSFVNNTLPNTQVTVPNFGPYTLTWTETNGPCPANSKDVVVTFFNQSVANAGVDTMACSLTTNMKAFPSFGTGTWSLQSGPGSAVFANTHQATSPVSVNKIGTYVFKWVESNGNCPLSTDFVTILFKTQPVADAGPRIDTCGRIAQLKAKPSVGTGLWTTVSGPGTITYESGTNNPNTAATASKEGTYLLRWSEDNGPTCSVSAADVIVNFNPATEVSLKYIDSLYCGINDSIDFGVDIPRGFPPYTFDIVSTYGTETVTTSNNYYFYTDKGATKGASVVTFTVRNFRDGSNCNASFKNNDIIIPRRGTNLLPVTTGFSAKNNVLCNSNTGVLVLDYFNTENLTFYIEDVAHNSTSTVNYQGTKRELVVSNLEYGDNVFRISSVLNDNGGCEMVKKGTLEVIITYKPVNFNLTKGDATCFGYNDGNIFITDQVGRPDWSEALLNTVADNGLLTNNYKFNLTAGPYTVKIKNSVGCEATRSVTITQPAQVLHSVIVKNPTCYGYSNGNVEIQTSGGSGKLVTHYRNLTASGTFRFFNQPAGKYAARITDSITGCIIPLDSIVIGQPDSLIINSTARDVNCDGTANGSLTIEPAGGTAPYTASVTRGAYVQNLSSFTPSTTANGLQQGVYVIRVIDFQGCIANNKDTVEQGIELTFKAEKIKDADCFSKGVIKITQPGNVSGTKYSIDGTSYDNTTEFSGLNPGTYTIYAKTAANCVRSMNFTILDNNIPFDADISSTNPVTCYNGNDGKVKINVSGGSGNYSIVFNGVTYSQTEFTGLGPGEYIFNVVDNKCGKFDMVTVTLTNPASYSDTVTQAITPTCWNSKNGTIRVSPKGGTPGTYRFSINNGATYQFSNQFPNLPGGTYMIRSKDGKGCESVATQYVFKAPDSLGVTVTIDRNDPVTRTSDVTLSGFGGVPQYYYSKDGSNFPTSNKITGIPYSYVRFYVKDNNGCINTKDVALGDVGITMNASKAGIKVFPNPTSGTITIEGAETMHIEEINVINAIGQTVMTLPGKSVVQQQIDLGNLPKGIYQLLIRTETNTLVTPVEVIH